MQAATSNALVVGEGDDKTYRREIQARSSADLPAGDLPVQVRYSSLNCKDALPAGVNKGVTRSYPHTPENDAAGVVAESHDVRFKPGDEVIVKGCLRLPQVAGYAYRYCPGKRPATRAVAPCSKGVGQAVQNAVGGKILATPTKSLNSSGVVKEIGLNARLISKKR